MVPSLASVLRTRYIARVMLRIVAVAVFLIGSAASVHEVARIVLSVGLDSLGFASLLLVALGPLMYLATAAALIFFERPLIRWLLPLPRMTRPECNFRVASLSHGACPECGLRFGPDERPAVASTPQPVPRPAQPRPPQG